LSPVERRAFRELAQELTSRLRGSPQVPATAESGPEGLPAEHPEEAETAAAAEAAIEQALLDRIPVSYTHLYGQRSSLARRQQFRHKTQKARVETRAFPSPQ